MLHSGLNKVGSCIPETGNHAKLSGLANCNSNSVPTKNDGIEYKINNIKENPLSTAESFLYAEYIPIGILIKYAIKIDIRDNEKEIPIFCHIFVVIDLTIYI